MIKQNFKSWKEDSERVWRVYGFRIKILSSKRNTFKTIFSIIGIFSCLILIIGAYSLSVGALSISQPQNNSSNCSSPNILTFKVIHIIEISNDTKDFINQTKNDIINEVNK